MSATPLSTEDPMASITINQLVKQYDNGFRAVKGIELAIRDREFMVLVGPSGCGKTTTLRMIAGLEDITAGEIRIGERRVNEVEPKDRDIAMVFQNYALYPHMTVAENMGYALKLRKIPKADIDAKVQSAAQLLSLTEQLAKLPKQLSGGQRQRVAVGRAIVRQPQVFLFDEPLSNLDAKLRGEMRYELKTLQQRLQTTMVYVTHDQIEAMTLGDRITVMSNGEIQQVAAATTVYDQPFNRFVASFIGTPVMNFLAGAIERAGAGLAFRLAGGGLLPLTMPEQGRLAERIGQPLVLGVRPERLAHGGHTPDAPGLGTVELEVAVIELMGDHQYVYLRGPGIDGPLIMKCDSHHRCAPGDRIPVRFATTLAHVFASMDEHAENLTLPAGFARQQ